MNIKIAPLISLLMAGMVPGLAYAGNEMGNGADHFFGDTGAAWFTGAGKTVSVCIESSPLFQRSDAQVEMDVQIAWAKWLGYFATRGGNSGVAPNIDYPKMLRFQPCDGTEDLRLMLGVEDSEVTFQKNLFDNPTAISYREKFDDADGWGKGWIWFCLPKTYESVFPDWSGNKDFPEILLHEVGHVLGNPHVEGTVMDLNLSPKLFDGEILPQWLGKIDQSRELIVGSAPHSSFSGMLGTDGYFDRYRAFKWLMGRDAQGAIVTSLTVPSKVGQDFMLSVADSVGAQAFTVSRLPTMNDPGYVSDTELFKRLQGANVAYVRSGGSVSFATFKGASLGDTAALIDENMSSDSIAVLGPIEIQVVINGYPQTIFRGYPQN